MVDADHAHRSSGDRFRDLLERHPNALVAAAPVDGMFIDPPDGLPGNRLEVGVRAATQMVVEADRVPLTNAWYQAVDDGYASVEVGLIDGDERATFHLIDVRADYGCFAQVLVPEGDAPWQPSIHLTAPPEGPPKIVRTRKSVSGILEWVDPRIELMLGWTPDEMVGRRSIEFIHDDHHDESVETWLDMLTAEGATTRHKVRHATKDGGWKWLEISNRNLLDDEGYVESDLVDITEEIEAQAAVRASEQLFRQLAASLPVGVIHLDVDGRVQYVNERCREILGILPANDPQAFALVLSGLPDPAAVLAAVGMGRPIDASVTVRQVVDGEARVCTLAIRPLTDDENSSSGALVCLTDVTESAQLREELARRALTDNLTGCLNRAGILAELERAILKADDGRLAVVFVDLDEFKGINDRFGHHVGDQVLQHVSEMLHASIRHGDSVGRLGGDEFLLVCHHVPNAQAVRNIATRIEAVVATPIQLDGHWFSIGASVGTYRVTDARTAAIRDIVARADAEMYEAKLQRRTRRGVPRRD